jgi:hypothetical protein
MTAIYRSAQLPATKHCDCTDCQRNRIHRRIHHIWDHIATIGEANAHREVACLALELAEIADQERGYDTRN